MCFFEHQTKQAMSMNRPDPQNQKKISKKKKSGLVQSRMPTLEHNAFQFQLRPQEMVYYPQEQMPYYQHQQSIPPTTESDATYRLTVTQTDMDYNIRNAQATEMASNSLLSSVEQAQQNYFYCLRVDGILENHYRRNVKHTDGGHPMHSQPYR